MGINIKHKVKGFYKSYALQGRTLRKAGVPTKLRSGPTLITKRVVFTFAVLALVTTSFVLLTRSSGNKTDAAWFDHTWQYRQKLTFTNSESEINADRKVKFEINTSTLVTDGKLQSNCADIRFTDVTGKLLDYFIDTQQGDCNTSATHFYIKLNKIIAGDQSVFVYYGNPGASSVQKNDFFADNTLGQGLVGYWPMDESSANSCPDGKDTCDYSGMPYNGNWDGDTSFATGKINNGVSQSADGVGSVDMGTGVLDMGTSNFSLGMWIKLDSLTTPEASELLDKMNSATTGYHLRVAYNDEVELQVKGTSGSVEVNSANGVITTDTWYHIVAVYDSTNGSKIYVDGVQSGSTVNGNAGDTTNADGFQLMRGFNSWEMDGTLDDVRIYSRVLTASEVSQIYNAGSGSNINVPLTFTPSNTTTASEQAGPGPVLYLSFDEGQGTTAYDKSGKGNNGTITGATWQSEDKCISGKCLLAGGGKYVTVNDAASLDLSEELTLTFWWKPTELHSDYAHHLVSKQTNTSDANLVLYYFGDYGGVYPNDIGKIRMYANAGGTWKSISGTYQVTEGDLNKWMKISFTYKSDIGGQLYINAQKSGSLSGSGALATNSQVIRIGQDRSFFDEVKIYPYALTDAQVKADYTAQGGSAKGVTAYVNDDKYRSLNDGLVGYWPMEDNVSGDAQIITDASGNGNNGTTNYGANTTGMDCTVSGKFGIACEFDGTDDFVEFNGYKYPNANSDYQMTTSVWVKVDTDTTTRFILGDINGGRGDTLVSATNRAQCRGWDTSEHVITGTTDLDDGNWHQVVCVSDRTTTNYTKMYVDGQLEGEMIYSSTIGYGNEYIKLADGTSGGKYPLSGAIDEVRIYNRALSPAEVQNLYEWAPGPVAHYTMDDGVQGDSQTIIDSSGNGNNGTTNSANGTGMNCKAQGQYGGACEFDGVDDYVSLNTDGLIYGNKPRSMCGWFKTNSVDSGYRFGFSYGKPAHHQAFFIGQFGPSLYGGGYGNDVISANYWVVGEWNHICLIYDSVVATLYSNGQYLQSGEKSWDTVETAAYIGRQINNNEEWDGALDDLRIYNYALTPKQIRNIMNARPVDATAVGSPLGSPIAHYTFDEGYGTTAYDSVGGYNGTFGGTTNPAWVGGKYGKALDFTATTGNDGSRVSYTGDDLDIGTNTGDELTLSMWLKPDVSQTNTSAYFIRNGWGADENYGFLIRELSGGLYKIRMEYYDGAFRSITSTNRIVPAGEWSHLVIEIIQGTSVSYYVNGEFKETVSWIGNSSVSSNSTFNIGGHAGTTGQSYDGLIDEVKIYNYALTPDEIAQDYNQSSRLTLGTTSTESDGTTSSNSSDRSYCVPGDTATCNPPVFEMTFDQQKVSGAGQTIYDTSGNSNNGTTSSANGTGMDCTVAGKVGNACEFDGVDDYVTFPSNGMVASAGTISMWLKPEPNIEYRIFHNKYDSNEAITLSTTSNGNRFNFNTERNNISYIVYDSNFQTNQWNFISAIWEGDGAGDDDVISLYVNGVLVDSDSSVNVANQIASTSTLGTINTAANSFYPGKLDQVRIYNYARTPAQIAWEYNGGAPVAWYKFDECQGTTIYDWSENANGQSNGNHGTLTIGATGTQTSAGTCSSGTSTQAWNNGTTGKWGSAFSGDGTNDYVSIPDDPKFESNYTSISAWINPEYIVSTSPIFNRRTSGNVGGSTLEFTGGSGDVRCYFYIDGAWRSTNLNTSDHISTNEWSHLTCTYDGSTIKLYKNGKLSNSTDYVGVVNSPTSPSIWIGRNLSTSSAYFNGLIDDVRIYNYALTPEQVKSVYNDGAVNFR